MKKIKLDQKKLILKKKLVGNLTDNEMKEIFGGEETGIGGCTNFTIEGTNCQTHQGPPYCGDWYNPTYGGCATVGCQTEAMYCTQNSIPLAVCTVIDTQC